MDDTKAQVARQSKTDEIRSVVAKIEDLAAAIRAKAWDLSGIPEDKPPQPSGGSGIMDEIKTTVDRVETILSDAKKALDEL